MSAVNGCSIGFTSQWGSACIPRFCTPVEANFAPGTEDSFNCMVLAREPLTRFMAPKEGRPTIRARTSGESRLPVEERVQARADVARDAVAVLVTLDARRCMRRAGKDDHRHEHPTSPGQHSLHTHLMRRFDAH